MADIDCTLVDVNPEQAFRKLLVMDDSGCPALRVTEVVAGTSDEPCNGYVSCGTEEDWKTLFFKMIDITDGCWSLKVVIA